MKKQAYNPFLPLDEYIADGEPHVFGDRVYLIGSHDKENGSTFCMLDYVFWSAPIDDLSNWTNTGIVYEAKQDPLYDPVKLPYMFAPDVVQGYDGRFYLYYCMAGENGKDGYSNPISVAVSSKPDGKYEYLGHVRSKDGKLLTERVCFDPAVFNDDGTIRLYYGTSFEFEEHRSEATNELLDKMESEMFGRSISEIQEKAKTGGVMGPFTVVLENDMLTAQAEPKRLIANNTKNTSFEGHGFFEAISMKKINGLYYFIYSSRNNHELCYATSKYPDKDFTYQGTIVSNGDVGFQGRTAANKTNATGTNHGSIEYINGQWYVFYHRLTHLSDYSRQACAEPITILESGKIPQVEITSCGLNDGPLVDNGKYPAAIACMITNGQEMPSGTQEDKESYPCVFSYGNERVIRNIEANTKIGFKYFDFQAEEYQLTLTLRGNAKGYFKIAIDENMQEEMGQLNIESKGSDWKEYTTIIAMKEGKHALFFTYHGEGKIEWLDFTLTPII